MTNADYILIAQLVVLGDAPESLSEIESMTQDQRDYRLNQALKDMEERCNLTR